MVRFLFLFLLLLLLLLLFIVHFFSQPFYTEIGKLQNRSLDEIIEYLGKPTHYYDEKGFIAWEKALNFYTIQIIQINIDQKNNLKDKKINYIIQKNIYNGNTRFLIKTLSLDAYNSVNVDYKVWPF